MRIKITSSLGPHFPVTRKYAITWKFLRSHNSIRLKELTWLFQEHAITHILNSLHSSNVVLCTNPLNTSDHLQRPQSEVKWLF